MAVVLAWFRLDFRRRWKSLLVLALLVALAAGTVMTAVAGAKRGSSAVDRLVAQTLPADVAVLPNEPGFDWDAVRSLPEVEALSTFVTGPYVVAEAPPPAWTGAGDRVRDDEQPGAYPPADAEVMHTIELPVVLDGRLPDPARADEVVVTPVFADKHEFRVGDTVTLGLYRPESVDAGVQVPSPGVVGDPPDGPVFEARIVGLIRSPWFQDEVGDREGHLVPSSGLYVQYRSNLVGASGEAANLNAMVRLRAGAAAVDEFTTDLERVIGSDVNVIDLADETRHAAEVAGFEADALLAFALVAGIVAVVLVGQSVVRHTASAVPDLQVLRSVGVTSTESGWIAAAGPTVAAAAGSILGVAGTVVASQWFPIGTARLFEPKPGTHLDLPVLLTGAVAASALVGAGSAVAARLTLRSAQSGRRRRGSVVAALASRIGAPVPMVTGTRFALEPGNGAQAVPARPALFGSVAGVLGVLAALTFAAGVEDATHPARFGQVHQLEIHMGVGGADFVPRTVPQVMAADPNVLAVNDTRLAVAQAGNARVMLFTLDPIGTAWEPVVLEGRVPTGPAEVALAPGTAKAVGASVGDTLAMAGTSGARTLTVTGLAFVPEGPENDYASGGWLTPEGFGSLFASDREDSTAFLYHAALLALRPGADPQVVVARIEDAAAPAIATADSSEVDIPGLPDFKGLLGPPSTPSKLYEVREIRTLPVFLAGFLALLGVIAVGHALSTAIRRRRHDVAVLRAVGMTRWQSRGVVVTQASLLAVVGLAVGVPLGVALGRTVWRYVAETTPVFYVPPVALLALLLVAPVALLGANLLAVWPGHRAASMRVSQVLRAE